MHLKYNIRTQYIIDCINGIDIINLPNKCTVVAKCDPRPYYIPFSQVGFQKYIYRSILYTPFSQFRNNI